MRQQSVKQDSRRVTCAAVASVAMAWMCAPLAAHATARGTLSCLPRWAATQPAATGNATDTTVADGRWIGMDATPPEGFAGIAAIRDTRRERTVVYDGANAALWELTATDPARWVRLDADGTWPAPRSEAAVTYDAANDRLLMFGGRVNPPGSWSLGARTTTAELWALTFSPSPRWTLLAGDHASPVTPRARYSAAICYDAPRRQVVVCGGSTDYAYATDVWAFDDSAGWHSLAPPGFITPNVYAPSFAFDAARERLLLVGYAGSPYAADVWALELRGAVPRWQRLTVTGDRPPDAYSPYWAVWDSLADRLIAFSGRGSGYYTPPDRVWTWSAAESTHWSSIPFAGVGPGLRSVDAFVWDAARRAYLAIGGGSTEAWAVDVATGAWRQVVGATTPMPVDGQAGLLYDAPRDRFVTWTPGYQYFDDVRSGVWSRDAGRASGWTTQAASGPGPYITNGSATVYDSRRHRLIVFGGEINQGNGEFSYLNDVYSVPLDTPSPRWTHWVPAGQGPLGGDASSVMYDPVLDRVLVFGGLGNWTQTTWALSMTDPPAWSVVPTHQSAPFRFDATAVYDAPRRRMLIVGGASADWTVSGDIWALSLDDTLGWTQMPAVGEPPARVAPAVAYDAVRDRLVVWGGKTGNDDLNDLWEYSLAPGGAWRQLHPSGAMPAARIFATAVFDPHDDCLMLFGGKSGSNNEGRTFYTQRPLTSTLYFSSPFVLEPEVTLDDARVRLRWSVRQGAARRATVWRRAARGDWAPWLDAVRLDDSTFAALDASAQPGESYSYALVRDNPIDHDLHGEIAVDVPPVQFGVRVPMAQRGAAIECTVSLEAPGPARLDIVDVRGRVLSRVAIAGARAGKQIVSLAGSAAWPRGVYFARVLQAGRAAAPARFVLAH